MSELLTRRAVPVAAARWGPRCVLCHDGLAGAAWACPGCGALLPADCAHELRGCPTLGCGQPKSGEGPEAGLAPNLGAVVGHAAELLRRLGLATASGVGGLVARLVALLLRALVFALVATPAATTVLLPILWPLVGWLAWRRHRRRPRARRRD